MRRHPAAARAPSAVRVSSVFCARLSVGTAPRPSRSSGTKCRPSWRRRRGDVRRDVLAEQRDRARRRARVLARQRGHQLLLAVARDAGDADDLAGAHVEADVLQVGAERVCLGQRQPLHREHHLARPRAAWCCSCGGSVPIIRRDRLALLSFVGSTSPVTLPPRSTVQWWHSARISSSLWLM